MAVFTVLELSQFLMCFIGWGGGGGGGGREGSGVQTWPKKPKMALITEYLPAAASADATADATCRINIS